MTFKITLKKAMLVAFACILIFQTVTFANNRIVYGSHCKTHGGTENCDGWRFSIETTVNHKVINWVSTPTPPFSILIVDNMLYPNPPPEATATSCNHMRGWCFLNYNTSLVITDPNNRSKKFPYSPAVGDPYIGHLNEADTGGASLNRPNRGDITIERSSW